MVPASASMTGVLTDPMGWMDPQVVPLAAGAGPRRFRQTMAPVASASARTSLPDVTAKKAPLPPGAAWRKRGDAYICPLNVAANVVSILTFAAAARVNVGST